MATLQRSLIAFRRQGSSGLVWDDKYYLGEDGKVEYRELRPCQSAKGAIGMMDQSGCSAAPLSYPRSLSAPAKKPPHGVHPSSTPGFIGKFVGIPKSKSRKLKP